MGDWPIFDANQIQTWPRHAVAVYSSEGENSWEDRRLFSFLISPLLRRSHSFRLSCPAAALTLAALYPLDQQTQERANVHTNETAGRWELKTPERK